jgi:HEPN domain-containing protein
MTKKQYIEYWTSTAEKDWAAIQSLMKGKSYVHALFWAHLVLEKLCKAHWIKDHTSNHPPRIHNLVYLIEKTKLKPNSLQKSFLDKMNAFQLEGRYPDYQKKLYKMCNKEYTEKILEEVKQLRTWLLNNL